MKVAITADVHLQERESYPERYNALANILDQMLEEKIAILIIAGDLFDKKSQNYSEFDEFCKQSKYSAIDLYIIPGNHDPGINARYFTSKNIKIFNEPKIVKLGGSSAMFFFLPYLSDRSMGEIIAEFKNDLPRNWVLIGHGSYLSGIRDPNPYETGVYMPLSRSDVEHFRPAKVILGHIHKKMEIDGTVHYTGSPCGLDINETGKRSFLVADTDNPDFIIPKIVDTDRIFLNETLITLPLPDEFGYAKSKIDEMIKKWGLAKNEEPKARIRLKIRGYTSDKGRLKGVIMENLSAFAFYNNEEPDLTEVLISNDSERFQIVEKVKQEIAMLEWLDKTTTKEDILEMALHIILKE